MDPLVPLAARGEVEIEHAAVGCQGRDEGVRAAEAVDRAEPAAGEALEVIVVADLRLGGGDDDTGFAGSDRTDSCVPV